MGKAKTERSSNRSKTLPSSPTHSFSSSSSSDFEFRISISPRKSSASLCPADELFYKGQLLPLQLSPRISLVRNLLASSSTSSSATATSTSASRDSSSSTDSTSSSFAADLSILAAGDPCCDSSRPSSVTDEDHLLHPAAKREPKSTSFKYFSSFSRIFKKDPPKHQNQNHNNNNNNNNKMSVTAKEVIRKYLKKVKPLYEKLSQKQAESQRIVINGGGGGGGPLMPARTGSGSGVERSDPDVIRRESSLGSNINNINNGTFSGNLKYCPRMIRRSYVASCPSSMRSSPSHSGVLNRAGLPVRTGGSGAGSSSSSSSSSETSTMEELQNAIQGAIAHCKNSMLQQNSSSFSHTSTCVIIGKGKAKEI